MEHSTINKAEPVKIYHKNLIFFRHEERNKLYWHL